MVMKKVIICKFYPLGLGTYYQFLKVSPMKEDICLLYYKYTILMKSSLTKTALYFLKKDITKPTFLKAGYISE